MADNVTLDFIGTQMLRLIDEQARMRDSIDVLTGITIRLEGAVNGLTLEIAGLRSMVLDHDRKLGEGRDGVRTERDEARRERGSHLQRSGEVFARPILFPLAALGVSVPDIPMGFLRRLTQAHSRLSSTYFFDFTDDS